MKLFLGHDIIICCKIYPFFPFKGRIEYDKSDMKVLYLKFLLWSPMLDFCTTKLVYLENLIS